MPGPLREAHKIVIEDHLLERISQDLDTRTSQEHPRRAFIQACLRHGICRIFRQCPLTDYRGSGQGLHKIF